MREWFLGLQPRERHILMVGAAAAVVIVIWGFVWLPISRGSQELRDAVADKRLLLSDLRRAEALGASGGASRAVNSASESLVVLIDSTSKSAGLAAAVTRTRPDGPDGISVSFQNAPFDGLLTWLVSLESEYGVSVETASFNGAREQGLVSGQLFLRR